LPSFITIKLNKVDKINYTILYTYKDTQYSIEKEILIKEGKTMNEIIDKIKVDWFLVQTQTAIYNDLKTRADIKEIILKSIKYNNSSLDFTSTAKDVNHFKDMLKKDNLKIIAHDLRIEKDSQTIIAEPPKENEPSNYTSIKSKAEFSRPNLYSRSYGIYIYVNYIPQNIHGITYSANDNQKVIDNSSLMDLIYDPYLDLEMRYPPNWYKINKFISDNSQVLKTDYTINDNVKIKGKFMGTVIKMYNHYFIRCYPKDIPNSNKTDFVILIKNYYNEIIKDFMNNNMKAGTLIIKPHEYEEEGLIKAIHQNKALIDQKTIKRILIKISPSKFNKLYKNYKCIEVDEGAIPPGLQSSIPTNTCFQNSAIQILYRISELRNYLIKQKLRTVEGQYSIEQTVYQNLDYIKRLIKLLNKMKSSNDKFLTTGTGTKLYDVQSVCPLYDNRFGQEAGYGKTGDSIEMVDVIVNILNGGLEYSFENPLIYLRSYETIQETKKGKLTKSIMKRNNITILDDMTGLFTDKGNYDTMENIINKKYTVEDGYSKFDGTFDDLTKEDNFKIIIDNPNNHKENEKSPNLVIKNKYVTEIHLLKMKTVKGLKYSFLIDVSRLHTCF
jgi:hypothetical protein